MLGPFPGSRLLIGLYFFFFLLLLYDLISFRSRTQFIRADRLIHIRVFVRSWGFEWLNDFFLIHRNGYFG